MYDWMGTCHVSGRSSCFSKMSARLPDAAADVAPRREVIREAMVRPGSSGVDALGLPGVCVRRESGPTKQQQDWIGLLLGDFHGKRHYSSYP